MRKTIETIIRNQEQLASLTTEEINSMRVLDLRRCVRTLGITGVNRGQVTVAISFATASELKDVLEKALLKQRELFAQPAVTSDDLAPVETVTAEAVLKILSEACYMPSVVAEELVSDLATKAYMTIYRAAPDTKDSEGNQKLRHHTRCNLRSELVKDTLWLVNESNQNGIRPWFNYFKDRIAKVSEQDTIAKNKAKEARVDSYAKGKKPVKLHSLLSWSVGVLEACEAGKLRATDWKAVAVALGLVTGRRMYSEVLYTLTQLDNGTWYNLAKSKDDEVSEIPNAVFLCEPELVENALAFLDSHGKRANRYIKGTTHHEQTEARAQSNKCYGKDLTAYFRTIVSQCTVTDDSEAKITIHDLRKFYILLYLDQLGDFDDNDDLAKWKEAARVFGHKNWSTSADNYTGEWILE